METGLVGGPGGEAKLGDLRWGWIEIEGKLDRYSYKKKKKNLVFNFLGTMRVCLFAWKWRKNSRNKNYVFHFMCWIDLKVK